MYIYLIYKVLDKRYEYPYTLYIYIYIYIYIYMHMLYRYIRTYIHTYIHTYIQTYIHTYIHTLVCIDSCITPQNKGTHAVLTPTDGSPLPSVQESLASAHARAALSWNQGFGGLTEFG